MQNIYKYTNDTRSNWGNFRYRDSGSVLWKQEIALVSRIQYNNYNYRYNR